MEVNEKKFCVMTKEDELMVDGGIARYSFIQEL